MKVNIKKLNENAIIPTYGSEYAAGADLYLSGRIGYHRMLDAPEEGILAMEVGHFASEAPVLTALAALVHEADSAIEVEIDGVPAIQLI